MATPLQWQPHGQPHGLATASHPLLSGSVSYSHIPPPPQYVLSPATGTAPASPAAPRTLGVSRSYVLHPTPLPSARLAPSTSYVYTRPTDAPYYPAPSVTVQQTPILTTRSIVFPQASVPVQSPIVTTSPSIYRTESYYSTHPIHQSQPQPSMRAVPTTRTPSRGKQRSDGGAVVVPVQEVPVQSTLRSPTYSTPRFGNWKMSFPFFGRS